MFGAVANVKPAFVPGPWPVVIETEPLVEPTGTIAMISVAVFLRIVAFGPPPKFTAVAPANFVPRIFTWPPAHMTAGAKLAMIGGSFTVSVKPCVANGGTPLSALIVIGYAPAEPFGGGPESVAVPS